MEVWGLVAHRVPYQGITANTRAPHPVRRQQRVVAAAVFSSSTFLHPRPLC